MGKPCVAVAALLLAACGSPQAQQPADMAGGELIDCATGGADRYQRDCTVEELRENGQAILVLRHPDGGFRRLGFSADGMVASDGSQEAIITAVGDWLEIAIDGDRYRLPASVLPHGGQ